MSIAWLCIGRDFNVLRVAENDAGPETRGLRRGLATSVESVTGNLHLFNEDRADLLGAPHQNVIANAGDVAEHVAQISGNGDFLNRMHDLAALHPVTRSAA